MIWVGLTGGIATGKSTVANLIKKMGIPVVDADELAKAALCPGTEPFNAVLSHFGPEVLSGTEIDRSKLGAVIFADPKEKDFLESVTHPWIQSQVQVLRQRYQDTGHAIAVYDVPLLFEKKLGDQFDQVWLVACSESQQIERLMARNRFTQEQAKLRIAAQIPISQKIALADFVIDNSAADYGGLEVQIRRGLNKLKPGCVW